MSFHLPAVIPKQECTSQPMLKEGPYGLPDVMVHGLNSVSSKMVPKHPLEVSEKNYALNQMNLDFAMMRNIQGIHAPLRMVMERQAAAKIQRLPFLQSSHLMLDTLTGRDETIGVEDIYNVPENSEGMQSPHIVLEKQLGLL